MNDRFGILILTLTKYIRYLSMRLIFLPGTTARARLWSFQGWSSKQKSSPLKMGEKIWKFGDSELEVDTIFRGRTVSFRECIYIYILYTYYIHIIYILYTLYIYIVDIILLYTLYTYYIHIIYCTYYLYIIYILFIYYTYYIYHIHIFYIIYIYIYYLYKYICMVSP